MKLQLPNDSDVGYMPVKCEIQKVGLAKWDEALQAHCHNDMVLELETGVRLQAVTTMDEHTSHSGCE